MNACSPSLSFSQPHCLSCSFSPFSPSPILHLCICMCVCLRERKYVHAQNPAVGSFHRSHVCIWLIDNGNKQNEQSLSSPSIIILSVSFSTLMVVRSTSSEKKNVQIGSAKRYLSSGCKHTNINKKDTLPQHSGQESKRDHKNIVNYLCQKFQKNCQNYASYLELDYECCHKYTQTLYDVSHHVNKCCSYVDIFVLVSGLLVQLIFTCLINVSFFFISLCSWWSNIQWLILLPSFLNVASGGEEGQT